MRARERELEHKVLQLTDQMIQYALSAGLLEGADKEHHLEQAAETVVEMAEAVVQVLQGRDEHLEALVRQVTAQKLPDRRILAGFGDFTQDLEMIIDRGLRRFRQKQTGESELTHPASAPEMGGQPGWAAQAPNPASESGAVLVDVTDGVLSAEGPQTPGDQAECSTEEQPAGASRDDSGSPPGVPGTGNQRAGLADMDVVVRNLQKIYPGEEVIRGHLFHGQLLDYYLPGVKTGLQIVENAGTARYSARLEYCCSQEGVAVRRVRRDEARNPRLLAQRLKGSNFSVDK